MQDALQVDGSNPCLAKPVLSQAVAGWLDKDDIDDRISIRVKSEGDPASHISFVLRKDDKPAAFRQFLQPPAECSDQRAVVALSIALAIDNALLESLGVKPEPIELAETPPQPPPEARPKRRVPRPAPTVTPRPRPKPREPIRVHAFAEAFAALRLLPDPSLGGLAGIDASWPKGLEVRAAAMVTAPTRVEIADSEAELSLAAIRFDGCFRQPLAPLQIRSCAGIASGDVVAEGLGFDRDFGVALRWTAVIGRLDLLLPLGDVVAVNAGLDGVVPLIRSKFRVTDERGGDLATRQMPAAGLGALSGVRITLPE